MADYVDTPKRLPRPHRLGDRGDPQRDHVRAAAQAHGLDDRGLPRRRQRPAGPKPSNAGDNLFITSDWDNDPMFAGAGPLRLPEAGRLPRRHRQGRSRSAPRCTPPTRSAARARDTSIITFGSATCRADGVAGYAALRARPASTCRRTSPATCGCRYYVERDKVYDTLQLPGQPLPGDRRPLRRRPRPGAPGRRHLGHRRGARHHGPTRTGAASSSRLPGVDKAAHMWGGVNDPEPTGAGYDPMTHLDFAAATADAQVGPDHGRARGERRARQHARRAHRRPRLGRRGDGHFHGTACRSPTTASTTGTTATSRTTSTYNSRRRRCSRWSTPGNVGLSYSDSSLNVWLIDQSPAKVAEAAAIMEEHARTSPPCGAATATTSPLVSPVRYDLMTTRAERQWFDQHAQELVDTQAAAYGPDLIATLPDNTTYSVAGDHGGIQRAAQQIPIVFAGAGLSSKDVKRSGAVGRHHADDPQGDGHHADRRHGRSGLPAAVGEVALAGRLPRGARLGLAGA